MTRGCGLLLMKNCARLGLLHAGLVLTGFGRLIGEELDMIEREADGNKSPPFPPSPKPRIERRSAKTVASSA